MISEAVSIRESVAIRQATPKDVKYLEALHSMINSANRSEASWTGESHLIKVERIDQDSLRTLITKGPSVMLLAFSTAQSKGAENPIGCVEITIKGNVGALSLLAVDPRYQSKGIASLFSDACEKFLISHGIPYSSLWVLHRRNDIKEWYRRQGYRPTGRTDTLSLPKETVESECYLEEWSKALNISTALYSEKMDGKSCGINSRL